MRARVHVHLKVSDLGASRDFYERLFGVKPVKVKPDQIKFLPPMAPLNLALSIAHRGETPGGFVNHLGIELASESAVREHLARVKAAGLKTREQLNVNCCYANQSKFWVVDPDGVEWEVYHVNHDLVEKHGGGIDPLPSAIADAIAEELRSRSA
ncbi:MAG TPA: ArsI/CadI family heavy metal resistance metalloenzyme [Candidatus Binataceae bacterium]|jgi:catechol 2,3-dioxygenase-like lactoylglutathione lyase family enzyme|nr:ArsI/CadI family heavy metal resistance metalloenzyme [Candidatus Binataceae bacterium]